uniref:Glutamate/phenylalanine/leucine/valine/L-tryptophan dehydrogenase C-terminal domain-containing protein n=1 Tax=Strigamia maritima TaxID=126957 RepID=T1JHX7_STRMM
MSHDFLQEISEHFAHSKHEVIFFELGKRTNLLLTSFISNSTRGQPHGGIKLRSYSSVRELVQDGIKLSQSNSVKSALADLWIGGGKGIIPEPLDRKHLNPDFRQELCFDYGDFLSGLNGCFVGSADAGLNNYDINRIHSRTRYITGMTEDIGGLGNPAVTIAKGQAIISELLDIGVGSVYATDCSQKRVDDLKDLFSEKAEGRLEIMKVPFGDNKILSRKCHIFSPCAIGNLITKDTIPLIQSRIICGLAYNQLGGGISSKLLRKEGITFVSDDIIANRMGLVHDYIEAQGRLANDPIIEKHFSRDWEYSIFAVTKKILQKAKDDDVDLEQAAKLIADQSRITKHPLWFNRTELIVKSLIENDWHKNKDFWRKRSNFPGARNV